ncbi:sporulation inhibitor of replication protein SirA [Oceanobacillus senegalensis]|uniref:sporulation inhibitor of replication protein SirA n=1 Tax=Oceanobacillus senegalensis TaxID=1936063 RepID=UPI000A30E321|nr:sporulation inhibitor of replication protein SirA [Oceanobacillus senegalensis]
MYMYSIYWIREEIANHYFHKSDILYRFFKEYENTPRRSDLKNQYNFITHFFHIDSLMTHIKNHLKKHMKVHTNGTYMEIYSGKQYISLHISEKQIKFRCESLQDAEELLFPILRLYQPYMFVVGDSYRNFGWISPVKMPRDEQKNQVLYSCQ